MYHTSYCIVNKLPFISFLQLSLLSNRRPVHNFARALQALASRLFTEFRKHFKMRYQNWDVLLFADQFKVPLQEFKTTCQVIQDPGKNAVPPAQRQMCINADDCTESHGLQLNPLLLPTVTSFIPGLPAGAPFRVSIHAWQNPDMSRYIQTLKKPSDIIVFEARLFIDGRIAG